MTDFNLGRAVRETLADSAEADPQVIAHRLLMTLTPAQQRAALAECLPDFVRIAIGRQRMQSRATRALVDGPAVGTSRRRRALSELDDRVCIGGEWKILGDCTADDLDTLAEYHREESAKHTALVDRYSRYARLVRDAGKSTLREAFSLQAAA